MAIQRPKNDWWIFLQVALYTIAVLCIGYTVGAMSQPPQAPETRLGQDWNEQARQQQDYSQRLNKDQHLQRNTDRIERLERDRYDTTSWRWRYGY